MQSFGKYEGVMGVYVMKTVLEDCLLEGINHARCNYGALEEGNA